MYIYCIPGLGSDERLFEKLSFPDGYTMVALNHIPAHEGERLKEYAKRMAQQIDQSEPFVLLGMSFGGMIAVEIAHLLKAEQTIIISSAKNYNELPVQYRIQKSFPLRKWLTPKMAKYGAMVLQPIVEPDRNREKETFKSMLSDQDPVLLKRCIDMILTWDRTEVQIPIIHIHGDKDNTLPIKNIKADIVVKGGSHMMTLTEPDQLSSILSEILD